MTAPATLIVFDIDGTLTDSVVLHQQAFRNALVQIGVPRFDDAFHSYRHHTDLHIARSIFVSATTLPFDEARVALFETLLLQDISTGNITEISGAKAAVDRLKQKGYALCYATGSMRRPAVYKLDSIGITFDPLQLVASNQLEEREAIVLQAIAQAKTYYSTPAFDRVILYGDGLWDLKTAQLLNLDFVGVGKQHKELLLWHGMTSHIPDFEDFEPRFTINAPSDCSARPL